MSTHTDEDKQRRIKSTGRKRTRVDYEAFIRSWMECYNEGGSRLDLVRTLDITYSTLAAREGHLRKLGVNLPMLANSQSLSKIQLTNLASLTTSLNKRAEPSGPGTGMKKPPVV